MNPRMKAFEEMIESMELAAKAIKHEFGEVLNSPEWELGNGIDTVCKFYRAKKKPEVKND